jgi:predicted  nucleic acid-binding Zn-ribbon protein
MSKENRAKRKRRSSQNRKRDNQKIKERIAQKEERHRERIREQRAKKTSEKPVIRRPTRIERVRQTPKKVEKPVAPTSSETTDNFSSRLASINRDFNSLSFRTRNISSKVSQLDGNIKNLSTRISNIRNNRYYSQKNIEKKAEDLIGKWNSASSDIQSLSDNQINEVTRRQRNFESLVNLAGSIMELERYAYQLSDLSRDVNNIDRMIQGQLNDYQSDYNAMNNELITAEETISNLSNTSIEWKKNEHPIIAIKTHDLTNDIRGVLTFTNLRILFEEVKEVVLRKNLFFATEKKTTKEIVLDQPIGSIEEIEKGTVGFFKGAGLYFKFKPQTGLDELKFDTSGNEDEKIVYFYNYIISGEAERELESEKEDSDTSAPVNCPNCSAPYSEEILRGQTSVKCIYCGTVIML